MDQENILSVVLIKSMPIKISDYATNNSIKFKYNKNIVKKINYNSNNSIPIKRLSYSNSDLDKEYRKGFNNGLIVGQFIHQTIENPIGDPDANLIIKALNSKFDLNIAIDMPLKDVANIIYGIQLDSFKKTFRIKSKINFDGFNLNSNIILSKNDKQFNKELFSKIKD